MEPYPLRGHATESLSNDLGHWSPLGRKDGTPGTRAGSIGHHEGQCCWCPWSLFHVILTAGLARRPSPSGFGLTLCLKREAFGLRPPCLPAPNQFPLKAAHHRFLSAASCVVGVHSPCFCGGGFEFSPRDARKTVCLSLTLTPSSSFLAVSVVTFLQGYLGWVVVVVVYILFSKAWIFRSCWARSP